jgi:hypothetical protein
VGAEWKANVLGHDGPQWMAYLQRYVRWESVVVLALFLVGCAASWGRAGGARLLGFYLFFGYLIIGSALRGYERYLTPLLPVVFVIAAWGLWWVVARAQHRGAKRGVVVLAVAIAMIGLELSDRIAEVHRDASARSASHDVFDLVNRRQPRHVLFSGHAVPSVEWHIQGVEVSPVARLALGDDPDGVAARLRPGGVLVLDGPADRMLAPSLRATLMPVGTASDDAPLPEERLSLYVYAPTIAQAAPAWRIAVIHRKGVSDMTKEPECSYRFESELRLHSSYVPNHAILRHVTTQGVERDLLRNCGR